MIIMIVGLSYLLFYILKLFIKRDSKIKIILIYYNFYFRCILELKDIHNHPLDKI